MYIVCVIFCLFSALSRGVGALQISIIIFVLVWHSNYTHYNVMLKDSAFAWWHLDTHIRGSSVYLDTQINSF